MARQFRCRWFPVLVAALRSRAFAAARAAVAIRAAGGALDPGRVPGTDTAAASRMVGPSIRRFVASVPATAVRPDDMFFDHNASARAG